MHRDVFISHASEDKAEIARPLVEALRKAGLTVWFDEYELQMGDSLRRAIDRGLAGSTHGLIILSPDFFRKEWPQRELDALFAREEQGRRLLPVWHHVTRDDVGRASPLLADRYAVSSAAGIDTIVTAVLRAVGRA